MTDKSIVLESADETRQFGFRIEQAVDGQAIITVSGPLGAGKTTLAQGVARGLGIEDSVTSPTFTMMNEYELIEIKFFFFLSAPNVAGPVRFRIFGTFGALFPRKTEKISND